MFDLDNFVHDCMVALEETQPTLAVKEPAARHEPSRHVAAALPVRRAEIVPLHVPPELTVLEVVWTPSMCSDPATT